MVNHAILMIFILITISIPFLFDYLLHVSPVSAWLRSYSGIIGNFVTPVFLMFGLNMVFLANDVWGAHDRAQAAVATEGDELRIIARLASGIHAPVGHAIIDELNRYEHYTVEEDWAQLGQPGRSYSEAGGLGEVTVMIASPELAAATSSVIQTQLMGQMNLLRAARNTRYALAEGQVNPVKWGFAGFMSIVAMITVGFGHAELRRPRRLAFLLVFIVSTPTLVVLRLEANPFAGMAAVSSHPIALALDHSTKMLQRAPLASAAKPAPADATLIMQ